MTPLLQGEGPGDYEVNGVRLQAQAGLARLELPGPDGVIDVKQAAEGRGKAGDARHVGMPMAGQQGRAAGVNPAAVSPDALIVMGPDQSPGMGQKDPG